jgi:membrane-associated phospholipid phosphatase
MQAKIYPAIAILAFATSLNGQSYPPAKATSFSTAIVQTVERMEPDAGNWKTWVLRSGSELRLPAPGSPADSLAEIAWLKEFMAQTNATALEQARYWDSGSPPYRWIELLSDRLRAGRLAVSITSFRAYALLGVAMYDATIAAWDSKYAHNRPRPSEADSSVKPLVAVPRSPSYPCERSVVAGAAATVLAYLFPSEAADFQSLAEEAARSRLTAGIQYPSDVLAGLELGRSVGRKVVEYARADGTDLVWTASVPTGPGLWTGTNPGFATAPQWKPWFLASADEFRPPPPSHHESAERAAELAELRSFIPRSFNQSAYAFYWKTVEGVHTWWYDLIHRGLFETRLEQNAPRAARAYALMGIVQFDSHIASNDGKYTYWTIRPSQQDTGLTTVFPTPNFPSYPSNHSTHSAARAEIVAYLFPQLAEYARARGSEAGLSRLWAGIHFRSDHTAGATLGKAVAAKLITIAEQDGSNHGR